MAIDTAAKRFSAVNVGSPWRGLGYFPTGTVDAAERLAVAYLYSGIAVEVPVEVPDVEGATQESATTTLEGDGFVVVVETAYSPTVAEGLVISQSPAAGSFVSPGTTVTITVSLGPEPVAEELIGGHFLPQKDYRPELDEKRLRERRELREQLERAAGLLDAAGLVTEPQAALREEVRELRAYVDTYQPAVDELEVDLEAQRQAIERIVARTMDALVIQVAEILTDLINEMIEDDDAT